MQMVTFTKKKVKRAVVLASMVTAAIAVGAVAVFTSVGTQAQERKLPIYNVERGDNKIALTFDVAWENSNTSELIRILDEFDAQATFFVTGDWCDRYPEDVMMFYEAGHEIQNHSDQHPHVEGINVNELISDTKACSQKIRMITGEQPTLYRAPYGEYDDNLITTIEGMGLKPIQWDVEPLDTDGKRSTSRPLQIMQRPLLFYIASDVINNSLLGDHPEPPIRQAFHLAAVKQVIGFVSAYSQHFTKLIHCYHITVFVEHDRSRLLGIHLHLCSIY